MFFLFHSALAEVERHVVPVAVLLYRLLPDHINGLGGGEAGAGRRSPVRREVGEVQARVTGPDADMIQWRSLQGNQWALPPLCGVGRKILFIKTGSIPK